MLQEDDPNRAGSSFRAVACRTPPEQQALARLGGASTHGARVAFATIVAITTLMAAPVGAQHRLPPGRDGFRAAGYEGIRGITIGPIESSQQPGRGYGTRYTEALLDHLALAGVNWVSVTPFGRIWSLRSTEIEMDFEAPYEQSVEGVRRLIAQAHARGIRVLVIPHLWVEAGGWRGEIDPGSPDGWRAFHESYRAFVLAWARHAALGGADAFSIGVECKSWSGRFGRLWGDLIEDVRAVFPGLLTYSSNWDEAEDVIFWDSLDLVGINAFYPLAHHPGATYAEYQAGARAAAAGVERLSEVLDMPVLFVEIGYTTRLDAAVEPWLWPDDMSEVRISENEPARALEASLGAFLPEDWFTGFFVWRYYANLDDVSQEAIWGFSPHAKAAERVMRMAFASEWGIDRGPRSSALADPLVAIRSTVVH